jgi:hypothetical protein
VALSLLASSICIPAVAQSAPEDLPVRPVSRVQGEVIVQAAWELRKGLDPKPDCSHFVYAIYQQAGLDYTYASSSEIFSGIPGFKRVQKAQAGDLVVWPGHVGILVDPGEHTFYSSVVKGYALEDYRSHYWKRRGQPRFYRYLISDAQSAKLRMRSEAAPVVATAPKKSAPSIRDTSPATREAAQVPRAVSDDGGEADDNDSAEPGPVTAAKTQEPETDSVSKSSDSTVADTVFVSSRPRPLPSEVQSALSHAVGANSQRALKSGLRSAQRVDVADQFRVAQITIQGRSGFVLVDVISNLSIENGQAHSHRQTVRRKLPLKRLTHGWMMTVPREKPFVAREQAIKILSASLEEPEAKNEAERKRTMKLLDDLQSQPLRYIPVSGSD